MIETAAALMYHDVVEPGAEDTSGFPGRDAALYKVTPALLEQHLAAVIRATASGPPAFTFDDGGVSAMRAADALERHGVRGHFFVTANYIGRPGFVDRHDMRDLQGRGHIVGSHSCSHPLRMGHCSWERLVDEWTRSREIISSILGEAVTVGSVPGGDFEPAVAEAAAGAGLTELFNSEPTPEVRHVFGLRLRGRFTIQRWTTASTAAALARGGWLPRTRQAVLWNAKKIGKRVSGERYLRLRRLLLGHGDEVEWGDQGPGSRSGAHDLRDP
jgi:hypothetical protein